jgi:hypothetical protein
MIYRVPIDTTFNQFISSEHFGYNKKESIIINRKNTIRLSSITIDHPVRITAVNTFIKIGDKMFGFNYSGNPITQHMKDIANKIINSFTVNSR